MSVYDYLCDACGPFTAVRPMAEFALPLACDECGADAPRALLSAPSLSGMEAGRRQAYEVNERSAHAPKRGTRHASGCGCCSGKRSTGLAADGPPAAKSFPQQRPWMIGH